MPPEHHPDCGEHVQELRSKPVLSDLQICDVLTRHADECVIVYAAGAVALAAAPSESQALHESSGPAEGPTVISNSLSTSRGVYLGAHTSAPAAGYHSAPSFCASEIPQPVCVSQLGA
jgi:hypothetical protein